MWGLAKPAVGTEHGPPAPFPPASDVAGSCKDEPLQVVSPDRALQQHQIAPSKIVTQEETDFVHRVERHDAIVSGMWNEP